MYWESFVPPLKIQEISRYCLSGFMQWLSVCRFISIFPDIVIWLSVWEESLVFILRKIFCILTPQEALLSFGGGGTERWDFGFGIMSISPWEEAGYQK